MVEAGASEAAKPKTHSAFAQVIFRESGKALDLAGKAVIGLGGFGALGSAHHLADIAWLRLAAALIVGGAVVALGIYLQAKAEET